MAQSDIAGLFMTPDMYQQGQAEQQRAAAAQYATLDPFQRAAYGMYQGGQQVGNIAGRLLGGEDPQLKMIAQQQQLLSQIDMNNPESIVKGSQLATQMGNPRLAFALANQAQQMLGKLAEIQQKTAERLTPEQRNAQALSDLQSKLGQINALPEDTPGRSQALNSLTLQLSNLQKLTSKVEKDATPKEIRAATAYALSKGIEGSPEYTAAYNEAIARQVLGADKVPSFGADREAISRELYGKGFSELTQAEQAIVNKREETSAKGKVTVTNVIPGVKDVKDVPGLRSAIIATVKPFRDIVNTTDQALQAINDSMQSGNFISFNAARSQLAKSLSGSDVSLKEVQSAGGDPSIIGGLLDVTSKAFTGTPTLDTQRKIQDTLNAIRKVALGKGNAEIKAQRDLATRAGFSTDDFNLASNIPEFNQPSVGGGSLQEQAARILADRKKNK